MANKKLTNDQVQDALIQCRGLTTLAADALGVDYKTIMRYINASPKLQDVILVARHKRSQFAKSKLDEALMRGESWAIMFTLKNKTDPDGEFTGETNKHEHSGETKIVIEYADHQDTVTETASSADTHQE